MRKTPEEKLKELEATKAKVNARIAKEKAKMKKQARREETRLKAIVGAVLLEHMTHDEGVHDGIKTILKNRVTRDTDKEFLAQHLDAYLEKRRDQGRG